MQDLPRIASTALMLAAVGVFMPSQADAQNPAVAMPAVELCTATVSPARVAAGSEAVRVSVELSEALGGPAEVEKATVEGIPVALASAIPRAMMSADDEPMEPVAMGLDTSTLTLWLNTSEVEEGVHTLIVNVADHRCTGKLEVTPAS